MKKILILGGGGFIGGHLAKRLKESGCYIRCVDIQNHKYFQTSEICHEFIKGDLRIPNFVERIMVSPDKTEPFDEVYQLAADMGGAGYIFTGENDANVMYNSSIINLNVLHYATKLLVKKIFFSSSACIYPTYNQLDSNNPNCKEDSAYPANPDSEYGWEKLFSERLYLAFNKNYKIDVRIARFHNIFGTYGIYRGGKEKAPAAICRKVVEALDGGEIEIWGDGTQTRSFLYVDECIDGILKLMESDFIGPVNIGSNEMVTINELANYIIKISGKKISIKHTNGPIGINGRNSDNTLIEKKLRWQPQNKLYDGLIKTYNWIKNNE
jgi:nucleoside-diphosphate-sugar epimerase